MGKGNDMRNTVVRWWWIVVLVMAAGNAGAAGTPPVELNIVRASKPVVIDGKLDEWVQTAPVSYEVDPTTMDQKVKTYAMWDDQNLYLAYVVRDASPMKNGGNDPSAAFKSGDALHLYFSTSKETAANSGDGGPQDYHVLMTMQGGKPVIFAFCQQKAGSEKPTKISSPAGSIDIAWMGPVPGAETAVVTDSDPVSGMARYTAEVKIPLAFFDNFHPEAGRRVAADVAVDFSDAAGSRNLAKVWWHRGASQILDIPTELRFDRNLWGTAVFHAADDRPVVTDSSDLFVVPAPGPVTVDGDLSDWDLACAYGPLYVDPVLKDQFNITWAVMYDTQALYLAAVFKSAQPFVNDGGVNNVWWLGDSIEVRLSADPRNQVGDIKKNMDIMTFALWYNQAEGKDYLALQRSFNFEISDISSATIRSKATPGGRTFEARIPWTIVKSGNIPKAGDSIAITMAGIWKSGLRAYGMGSISSFRGMNDWGQAHFLAAKPTDVFVSLNQPAAAAAAAVVKCKTTVDVPEKGLLSAGVYSADGRLLRTLLAGKEVEVGKVEVGWDGSTDDGPAAAPGKYAVRAVLNAGLHAKYVTSAASPGKPPYDSENPRGGWGGCWDNVLDIATDASGIYPLWGIEEGDGLLIHADEDGNILWRQHCPLALSQGRQFSVAVNGKYVYVLSALNNGKAGLWRVSVKDGAYVPIPHDGSDPLAFTIDGVSKPEPVKGAEDATATPAAVSLAANAATLYVSACYQDQVACFDAETCKPLKTYPVEKPMGLCLDGADGLLVISGAKVVRLDLKSGACTPVVTDGLEAPFDVAAETNGMILVTDRGAAQQVKRFDRHGKLQGSFGKAGGRTNNGKFNVECLRNPAGIAVAASGKIFYTEDAEPKIFARLSPALSYEKLWSGPWYISGQACVDPYRPEDLYTAGGPSFIRHKIDYATKTSRPDALWTDFATDHGGAFPRIVRHDGVTYLLTTGLGTKSLFRVDGDKMLLLFSIGNARDNTGNFRTRWEFADLNENGKVDEGEKIVTALDPKSPDYYLGSYWGGDVDERDMSLYLLSDQYGTPRVFVLTPTFAKKGLPVYSFEKARILPLAAAWKPGQHESPSSIWHTPDGGVFGNADANGSDPRGIGHSSHLSDVYVYRLDKDGKLVWRAGKKASGIAKNGEFYGRACGLGGPIADQYFDFVDENGQDKVYTVDGLFVGNLLDDPSVATASEYTLRVEHFKSNVYQNALDKKWYFVAGAGGYASIWEIAGLDKVSRLQGEMEVK